MEDSCKVYMGFGLADWASYAFNPFVTEDQRKNARELCREVWMVDAADMVFKKFGGNIEDSVWIPGSDVMEAEWKRVAPLYPVAAWPTREASENWDHSAWLSEVMTSSVLQDLRRMQSDSTRLPPQVLPLQGVGVNFGSISVEAKRRWEETLTYQQQTVYGYWRDPNIKTPPPYIDHMALAATELVNAPPPIPTSKPRDEALGRAMRAPWHTRGGLLGMWGR